MATVRNSRGGTVSRKFDAEELRQWTMLGTRARRIPDKRKESSRRACRGPGSAD